MTWRIHSYTLEELVNSQVGFLAFNYLLLWDWVESFICSILFWAMDGVGVHFIDIGREVRPGEESLSRPPVPCDCGIKLHGKLLLEK